MMHEDLVPPDDITTVDEARKLELQTEWDVVSTLTELGHEVTKLGLYDDLSLLRKALDEIQPHIAFNLLEEFAGRILYDQNVVAYLELKGVPYTGCNPRGLMLAHDKSVAKKILHYHRIATPRWGMFERGRKVRKPKRLEYPLIVKSSVADASAGISQASVVRSDADLEDRVSLIHRRLGTAALVEEYIEGRELYVSVLGNRRLEVFPVWEMVFENLPKGAPRIATERVKFDPDYQEKRGITTNQAQNLDDETIARLHKISRRAYHRLEMSGYGRMDFRLTPSGRIYLLEANPNPNIADLEDFAMSVHYGGTEYPQLLERIMSLGIRAAKLREKEDV